MKLNNPIDIDILDFFKTGKFDYLKLGHSKEWILNNFPDPDGYADYPNIKEDDIWTYGDIELHFHNQILFLLYSEGVDNIDGGTSLSINKWILSHPNKLILSYVIEQLNKERIDFIKRSEIFGIEEYIRLDIIKSDVKLSFSPKDDNLSVDPNQYQLSSFSLMTK